MAFCIFGIIFAFAMGIVAGLWGKFSRNEARLRDTYGTKTEGTARYSGYIVPRGELSRSSPGTLGAWLYSVLKEVKRKEKNL